MRTKFAINDEIFSDNGTLTECFEFYENNYKEKGFVLDKSMQDVYIIFDKEIQLNEGDRVDLYGFRLVSWKCVNLIDDIIEYALEEE